MESEILADFISVLFKAAYGAGARPMAYMFASAKPLLSTAVGSKSLRAMSSMMPPAKPSRHAARAESRIICWQVQAV